MMTLITAAKQTSVGVKLFSILAHFNNPSHTIKVHLVSILFLLPPTSPA